MEHDWVWLKSEWAVATEAWLCGWTSKNSKNEAFCSRVCVPLLGQYSFKIGERDQWWGCGTQSLVLTVAFAPASGPFGFLVKVSPSLSGLLKPGMQEEGLFSMSLPPAQCIKLWSLMRPSTWSHNCTSLHVDYWNCHLLLIILLAPCKQCIYSALWFLCVTW